MPLAAGRRRAAPGRAVPGATAAARPRPPVPDEAGARRSPALVQRRRSRVPLQHLAAPGSGTWAGVGPGVFVPRPETEVVGWWRSTRRVRQPARSSSTSAPVGAHRARDRQGGPAPRVHAVEGPGAIARTWGAERNVDRASCCGRRRTTPALTDLDGTVDVVVSNPPYVPRCGARDPEVAEHDPPLALSAAARTDSTCRAGWRARPPAAAARRPARHRARRRAGRRRPRGRARSTGAFEQIESRDDLTGRPRMLVARRSSTLSVTDSAP